MARRLAYSSNRAGLPAAAARPCRCVPLPALSTPNQAHKPVAGESLAVLPPSPADPAARATGFQPAPPPPWPRDPIALLSFCLGYFVRSKGMAMNLQKVLGTLVKSCIFNSSCVFLNLVNSVENCSKIRKIQTQFCWIPRGKYYNFFYS
jgi:hypothetical protein